MPVSVPLRLSVVLVACTLLGACSGADEGGDCTSHYEPVASASTWSGLKEAMLANEDWGRVASLRTQARGQEADGGPGDQEVVRVMDLLNRKGRRLVQVDVWRTDGAWRAGAWSQCID
ncbi:hypothetical protein GCM10027600_36670 [Nocardioides ginsengisegetis]